MKKLLPEYCIFLTLSLILCASVTFSCTRSPKHDASPINVDPKSAASERWKDWRKKWTREFPIASWAYFSQYAGTLGEYTTYKTAGLTMVQAPLNQYESAKASGLKVITGAWQRTYEDSGKLDYYISYPLPGDTTTIAYNLDDEPPPSRFDQLSEAVKRIYQTDRRGAIPIITMLPDWAVPYKRFKMSYEDFVDSFILKVHPAVMVSTYYPTLCNGTDRPTYYKNIELFRRRALDYNIGLMGFVNITSYINSNNHEMCYRPSSESDIYWQVYSMIAYGVQGIWYYNYRIGDDPQFGEGIVFNDSGKPNPEFYPYIQAVDSQLNNLAPVLMKLRSVNVFHLNQNQSDLPVGTRRYINGSIDCLANIQGDNFIISEFKNQDNNNDTSSYIMIVNKEHSGIKASSELPGSIKITVAPSYKYVYRYDPQNGSLIPLAGIGNDYNISLDGGHGLLLRMSRTRISASS
jgi:hypothetical protein